jgi:hypothetical protein
MKLEEEKPAQNPDKKLEPKVEQKPAKK